MKNLKWQMHQIIPKLKTRLMMPSAICIGVGTFNTASEYVLPTNNVNICIYSIPILMYILLGNSRI